MSQVQLPRGIGQRGEEVYKIPVGHYICSSDKSQKFRATRRLNAFLYRVDLDNSYRSENGDTVIYIAAGHVPYFISVSQYSYLSSVSLVPERPAEGQARLW